MTQLLEIKRSYYRLVLLLKMGRETKIVNVPLVEMEVRVSLAWVHV